ncbi:hypothetical protein BD310DRAFT_180204 [Dichomitus squalens]|uniref:Uncharacterized protein n=1 Tax=Dichomitus squalens TaxID=114155 RepID=A0A4V2K6Q9_9APHY|nr:hypothetical protein BD310DRAFT_180204 [Dichomitus squalens]
MQCRPMGAPAPPEWGVQNSWIDFSEVSDCASVSIGSSAGVSPDTQPRRPPSPTHVLDNLSQLSGNLNKHRLESQARRRHRRDALGDWTSDSENASLWSITSARSSPRSLPSPLHDDRLEAITSNDEDRFKPSQRRGQEDLSDVLQYTPASPMSLAPSSILSGLPPPPINLASKPHAPPERAASPYDTASERIWEPHHVLKSSPDVLGIPAAVRRMQSFVVAPTGTRSVTRHDTRAPRPLPQVPYQQRVAGVHGVVSAFAPSGSMSKSWTVKVVEASPGPGPHSEIGAHRAQPTAVHPVHPEYLLRSLPADARDFAGLPITNAFQPEAV